MTILYSEWSSSIQLLAILFSLNCSPNASFAGRSAPAQITVYAAAALEPVLVRLAGEFTSSTGARVRFVWHKSARMIREIEGGASADLFISANDTALSRGSSSGLWVKTEHITFDRLVMVVPHVPGFESMDPEAVLQRALRIYVAQADVTVGRLGHEVLNRLTGDTAYRARLRSRLLKMVVDVAGNGQAVARKVATDAASIGIAYASDVCAVSPIGVRAVPFEHTTSAVADFRVAIVSQSREPDLARIFVISILGEHGQSLLRQHCFSSTP